MNLFSSRKKEHIFSILSVVIVLGWILYLVLNPPYNQSIPKPKINTESKKNDKLRIKIRKYGDSGYYYLKKTINLSETVVYIDMWRSHWCTYYNDREFFFTPRINELTQLLRSIGLPVVHISMGADAYTGHTKMRKAGIEVAKKGALPILEQYNAQAARYHNEYIPGFQDVCVYSEQERFGKYRDNHLTKQIVVAESDYIVQNFRESAESFVGLGKKTVIILGQHTNMCLMAVFLYCREVGLDLIFVRDLMDSCYVYELQKNHVKNHTAANVVVNKYIEKNFGSSVISYDLIRSIHKLDVEKVKPEYKMFANRAHIFKYIN